MQFLSAYFLWGLSLAGIPILLHLLFRRRFTRVPWAPMKILKMTLRKNRRRLRLEQWLLLLVRTLFVVLLILAVARPVLSHQRLLAWFADSGQSARVIILDDSLSMGYRAAEQSLFDEGIDWIRDIVKELNGRDTLTLVVATDVGHPVLKEVHADESGGLDQGINQLRVSEAPVRWATALQEADTLMRSLAHPVRDVTILTDFRKVGWDEGVTAVLERWADDNVGLNLVDLGPAESGNLTLLELEQDQSIALAGAPIRYRAVVRNDETFARTSVQATFRVGDRARPVMLPDLAPGEQTELVLTATFNSPGQHEVSLSLPEDRLAADNHRWGVVDVREAFSILLVDGEPGARPFESEIDYLSMAFSAGDVAWKVEHTIDADWLSARPEDPDLLVLANVAEIPEGRATRLIHQVKQGMGLMLFPGDQVNLQQYNESLYRNGAGLLPGALSRVLEEPLTGWEVASFSDSPLNLLSRLTPASLSRISAKRCVDLDLSDADTSTSRILARWNDVNHTPAVLEKKLGRGRVLFWSVTADRAWGDWPIAPTYVLAMREAARALARADAHHRNLIAGESIRYELTRSETPRDPHLIGPGLDAPKPLIVEENEEERPDRLVVENMTRCGVFQMGWQEQDRARMEKFSVNPDPEESGLLRIGDEALRGLAGRLEPEIVHVHDQTGRRGKKGGEIWRSLVWLVLGLLMTESALAGWVGRKK